MQDKEQIVYMQTRLVRLASEQWDSSKEEMVVLFQKYNIFEYIEQNYALFFILKGMKQFLRISNNCLSVEEE